MRTSKRRCASTSRRAPLSKPRHKWISSKLTTRQRKRHSCRYTNRPSLALPQSSSPVLLPPEQGRELDAHPSTFGQLGQRYTSSPLDEPRSGPLLRIHMSSRSGPSQLMPSNKGPMPNQTLFPWAYQASSMESGSVSCPSSLSSPSSHSITTRLSTSPATLSSSPS
jgi:hypothetical protein